MPKRARLMILLFCALLPAVVPAWMILRFGTDFPFWDEWDPDIAGIHVKAHQHQLTLSDLTAQHNEHRIVIPRLAYLVVGAITSNNMIAMMFCGWFAAGLTSLGILRLLYRTLQPAELGAARASDFQIASIWLLCNVIVFTPQQWQSWLWGMGLGNLLPAMFMILAIVVAGESIRTWMKVSIVVLLCFASTYTVGNGIVAWPLVGGVLLWDRSWEQMKRKLWLIGALALAFIVAIALYFSGYQTPSHAVEESRAGEVRVTLVYLIQFILAFIGNGFATATRLDSLTVATVVGTIIVVLLGGAIAYVVHRIITDRDRGMELADRTIVWFALAGYTIANAVLAAGTRAKFGIGQAVTPRYISFGLYAEMSLVPLIWIIGKDALERAPKLSRWMVLLRAATAVVILPPVFSWGATLQGCRIWQSFVEGSRGVMMLARVIPNNPQLEGKINPKAHEAVRNAMVLDEIGYLHPPMLKTPSLSAIEAPPTEGSPIGAFEKLWRVEGNHIGASGWAIYPARADRAATVLLTCTDAQGPVIFATAFQDATPRPDIVQKYQSADYQHCGWIIEFDARLLPTTLSETVLAAWVFDSRTGKAYRIAGDVVLKR